MQRAMAVRIYAALTSKFHRPDTGVLLRGHFDTTTPTNNFYNATDGLVAGGGQGDQRMVTPECDERYIGTMMTAVCVYGDRWGMGREGCRKSVCLQVVVFFWQRNSLGLAAYISNRRLGNESSDTYLSKLLLVLRHKLRVDLDLRGGKRGRGNELEGGVADTIR